MLLAGVAIWVAVAIYRRTRSRKALTYSLSTTELVDVHQAARDQIKIYFQEKQIAQAHLIEIRLTNTGNVPVLPEDFSSPLTVDLGEGAAALTLEVTDRTSPELHGRVTPHDHEVELEPMLLNPGDGLTLKILARDLSQDAKLHYRIVGVTEIEDANRPSQIQRNALLRFMAKGGFTPDLVGSGLAVLAAGVLVGAIVQGDEKSHTTVELTDERTLCADILHTSAQNVVLQLQDSGKVHSVAIDEVESLQENDC